MVTNPNGFVEYDAASWEVGTCIFEDLQVAIVADNSYATIFDGNWADKYSLDTAKSFYVDTNGDVIVSMTPVLSKSF